jgi:hypothetical protein
MAQRAAFDNSAPYLIRVPNTLLTERRVCRAAPPAAGMQPALSAQLGRLRVRTGDPLLVRAGDPAQPAEATMQMPGPGTQA